jgi:protein O-GlcNAc transferase
VRASRVALAYRVDAFRWGRTRDGGKLRVGFLSRFLYNHSVGRVMQGLIEQFDRQRFAVHALSFRPAFDAVLARILRCDRGGEIVIVHDKQRDTFRLPRLQARLRRSAHDVYDRIVFLPRAPSRAGYFQRLQACDVVLDTMHYCGGNTSLEAISMGTLVVTLPSELNRGRHTYAFFRKMGFMDTVAHTPDEYVDLAVRIATDIELRTHLRRVQQEHAHALYEDHGAVDQISDFFEQSRMGRPD